MSSTKNEELSEECFDKWGQVLAEEITNYIRT